MNNLSWIEEDENQTNPISSLLEIEMEDDHNNNWFLQQPNHNNNLLFDPPPFFLPQPKPTVNDTFDLGYGNGNGNVGFYGASNLNLDTQFPSNQFVQLDNGPFGMLNRSKLLEPLDNNFAAGGPPTLFQKRAALRQTRSDGEHVNDKKRKMSAGSWDDVDDLSLDDSCLNYDDSDEFTVNTTAAAAAAGGSGSNQKGKKKGVPAKNLMAERRRRKKLNDRLYMLRSVVPKISKMDRASILGDAIEYLKELLQKINDLNLELEATPSSSAGFYPLTPTPTSLPSRVKQEELCPTPTGQPARIEVRQREGRAVNIHMLCSRRPGLLLSTMRAIDSLGLDIQQAVISCFNGFALDVFRAEQCTEGQDVDPDEVKAVLLESAGYHGVA